MGARLNPTTGSWQPIPPTPSFEKSFKTGLEVNGTVHGEIRLIPNLQVEFYRVVAADLSIEPSITADIGAGLIPKGELLAEFGYAPIQLTKFDINLQAEAFVGVSVGIFSKKEPVLDKTKIYGSPQWLLFSLPKLSASGGSGKVNESINLTATTTDGKNNPFKDGSIKWFVSPNKATVSGGKAGTFTSSNEGSYTVFFSGHGYLGDPLARQFASAEVSVDKENKEDEKPANLPSTDAWVSLNVLGSSVLKAGKGLKLGEELTLEIQFKAPERTATVIAIDYGSYLPETIIVWSHNEYEGYSQTGGTLVSKFTDYSVRCTDGKSVEKDIVAFLNPTSAGRPSTGSALAKSNKVTVTWLCD
jgi:hypothetical protein